MPNNRPNARRPRFQHFVMEHPTVALLRQSGLVGVMTAEGALALKRHLLVLNCVVLPAWDVTIREVEMLSGTQLARELEWLREQGILLAVNPDDLRPNVAGEPFSEDVQ